MTLAEEILLIRILSKLLRWFLSILSEVLLKVYHQQIDPEGHLCRPFAGRQHAVPAHVSWLERWQAVMCLPASSFERPS
jgi:hypothetical protein